MTTTSTTFEDITGMTLDITPSATSSKILLSCSAMSSGSDADKTMVIRWMRDSNAIFLGTASGPKRLGFYWDQNIAGRERGTVSCLFLDSPASTSAITYHLEWAVQTGDAAFLGRSRTDGNEATYDPRAPSAITAMEVLA